MSRSVQRPFEKLILVSPSAPLCSAWRTAFAPHEEVEVALGNFEQLPVYDCMVAAGNCYGIMDGGVDAAISGRFPSFRTGCVSGSAISFTAINRSAHRSSSRPATIGIRGSHTRRR